MSQFVPPDPNFAERARATFARQTTMRTLAVELMRLDPGHIEMRMPYLPDYAQQHGFVHGGIITTVLDTACGCAALTLMGAEAEVLTVEFKTSLTAPAKGEWFAFEAQVIKPGRTLTFCEARAFAIDTAGERRLIAAMSATMMALYGRPGLR
jgi:uncharacterized protein (TIGR00369 family)